jgi:predicted metalloendopeptidase
LQPPYFDAEATDAMYYGALGAGLAHDMTHAVDVTGAIFDERGRPHNWWTDADQKAFQNRAQCIVDQYDGYSIEPGLTTRARFCSTKRSAIRPKFAQAFSCKPTAPMVRPPGQRCAVW